jgi:hypothetical protein
MVNVNFPSEKMESVAAYDKNVYDDSLGLAHILTKINDNYKGY